MSLIPSAPPWSRWTRLSLLAGLLAVATVPAAAQLSPADAAAQMGRGINMGNTLEPPTEGAWNNGPALESHFEAYKAAGFSTVRVPVRWDRHMGTSAPFTVNAAWMDRVEQVIDWGLERDLFVIINSHHDDWLKRDYGDPTLQARFDSLWSQIATRFQGKSDKLLFEMMNEPFDPMTLAQVNDMNARVLPIIRRTNPTRIVLYSGNSYSSLPQLIAADVPDDPYVMGYYHSYDPYLFGLRGQDTWGSAADRATLQSNFDRIASWSKSTGVPVMLGEFGAIRVRLNEAGSVVGAADYNSRMRHYGAYVVGALEAGIPFQAWDDGGDFRIYDRPEGDWEDVKDILIYAAPDGPNRFAASVTDDTLATLMWDAVSGSTGLVIQRRAEGGSFEPVAEIDASLTTYVDTVRSGPGDYTYRVISRSESGPDAYSYPQRLTFLPTTRSPYPGAPVQLPGTIQAEDYDVGGEGLTYHDTDDANVPGAYRPDDGVDIEALTGGGYQVTDIKADEWLEYTVLVPETGTYTITATVGDRAGDAAFSLSAGLSRSGTLQVPLMRGGAAGEVSGSMRLATGERVLRLQASGPLGSSFSLDRFTIAAMSTAEEDEAPSGVGFHVAPNPARQRVTVTSDAPVARGRIELYNALGQRVRDAELAGVEQSVDLDGLAPGIYLLRVVREERTVARTRLVVVR